MSKDTFYTAVDIGTDKVTSIMARGGSEGELKILGTGGVPSEGIQKGRIDNIAEVQVTVQSSLEEAQRSIGKGVLTGVYSSVSGNHISCLNTKEMIENLSDVGNISTQMLDRLLRGRSQSSTRDRKSSTLYRLATVSME